MSLADRARAAILACPDHWSPATLSRQLRVDVAELEPALATLRGLQRDAWRGVLSLPAPRRRRRRAVAPVPPRPTEERVALVRRLLEAGPLSSRQVSDALDGLSPGRTYTVLRRAGAEIVHQEPGRSTLWGLPGTRVSCTRESLTDRARRLLERRPMLATEIAAELDIRPGHAWQVLRRIGASHEGYATPWRLP